MKILLYSANYSESFNSLTNTILNTNHEVGQIVGKPNLDDIVKFSPNLIIYNSEKELDFFKSTKFATIHLPDSIVFADLDLVKRASVKKQYQCDISFIGSLESIGNSILKYFNLSYKIKIFHNEPLQTYCYCGFISRYEHTSLFKSSKVSIVHADDTNKLYEIVASDGTPVVYHKHKKSFIEEIDSALSGNPPKINITKKEILEKYTNYDIMSKILKENGFPKLASEVLSRKLI